MNTQAKDINPVEARQIALVVYGVMIAGMLLQLSIYTMLPASAALICAIVYAYVQRAELSGTFIANHYQWMTRTFWIGGAVYLPIITVISVPVIFILMDMQPVYMEMHEKDEKNIAVLLDILGRANEALFKKSILVIGGGFSLWWCSRMARGIYYLRRNQPVPDVTRWL